MKGKKIVTTLVPLTFILFSCGNNNSSAVSNSTDSSSLEEISSSENSSSQIKLPLCLNVEGDVDSISGVAGDRIYLPKITATSTLGEDISANIVYSLKEETENTILNRTYFVAELKGDYVIEASISEDSETLTKEINVSVKEAITNTNILTTENDLDVLLKGETFKENFEDGEDSAIGDVSNVMGYFTSTSKAIEGTSYYLDYNTLKGKDSTINFDSTLGIFPEGQITFEIDVKLVRGFGPTDLKIGYKEGTNFKSSVGRTLYDMAMGEIKHFSATFNITATPDNFYFAIKKGTNENMDFALSFDNLSIRIGA